MVSCLICGKDVDVRRAPAARVIGGAVVSFCSAACANQAQPARQPKMTAPVQNDDIVDEAVVPKRARTEPPKPPPGSGDKP